MNAAETLHQAAEGMRQEGAWGEAMADWFGRILYPFGSGQPLAAEAEVRYALMFANAYLGSKS